MQETVFYSWQTDSPKSVNRNFIEDALGKAIKKVAAGFRVEEAQRSDLVVDKDTKGVPGSPDIVEEIFKKIEKCAIFVADLTSVGKSKRKRLLPNPNVLIEYGYALKSVRKERIIGVMNTSFGKPNETNMPFNIKKLRWPIQYALEESAQQADREKVKKELVNVLVSAISDVMRSGLLDSVIKPQVPVFEAAKPTTSASVFSDAGAPVLSTVYLGNLKPLFLSSGPKLFLRIIPTLPTKMLSRSEAYKALNTGKLPPMRYNVGGQAIEQNRHGVVSFISDGEKVTSLSQLFLTKELWGIDIEDIKWEERSVKEQGFRCAFEIQVIEQVFKDTLLQYLRFAKEVVTLPLPLKFIAGLTDIINYCIAAPRVGWGFGKYGLERFSKLSVDNDVIYEGTITDYDADVDDLLRPFFDKIFDACATVRVKDVVEKDVR